MGLFSKKSDEAKLCKWPDRHQAGGAWRRSQVPLASGTGPFPSLCAACQERASGDDPALVAQKRRREEFYNPRHAALIAKHIAAKADREWLREAWRARLKPTDPSPLKPDGFDARYTAFERDHAALKMEAEAIFAGEATSFPEWQRAKDDPELCAERERFLKAVVRGSGSQKVKVFADEADEQQREEWEWRKKSVAAFQAGREAFIKGDYAEQERQNELGRQYEAEANKLDIGIRDIREQFKGVSRDTAVADLSDQAGGRR